jgi:predicted mannosyl-3-phosphoglycerate phosphatase (HAD superfamily)
MPRQSREARLEQAADRRGWELVKVGRRYRLVDASTGTVQADDWATSAGLPLDDIEQALNP